MSNLEKIAKELKSVIGDYDPDLFASRIVSIIHGLTHPWNKSIIKEMVSPFRQLLYLLNLNLTSAPKKGYKEFSFEGGEWERLVILLNEMEEMHKKEYGELKPVPKDLLTELDEDEALRRRMVGISTYNAFFHQGPLHFEEQTIEKVVEIFKGFNIELKKKFGWNALDFISLYDRLDNVRQGKQDSVFIKQKTKREPSREEFTATAMAALKSGHSFQEAMMQASPFDTAIFEYQDNPSKVNTFTIDDLQGVSDELIEVLITSLTSDRRLDDKFLFFSQSNQIIRKPIYKLDNGDFLVIEHRLLLSAMFSFLQSKCLEISKNKNRVTVARDKFLERKVEDIFREFYKKEEQAKVFPSYFIDGVERDLLVLSKDTALIIEAKAGNVREPMFDPDKAYSKIWSDFKETIDYGYEQAFSVKEKFLKKQTFEITDNKGNTIHSINPKIYKNIFCIIVTYNKFGHAQSDLWMMLDLYDDDNYPWAVCVDDLEIFLLAMDKLKFSLSDFHRFLRLRSDLHGNLIVNDEGRVLGHYLINKRFSGQTGAYRFSAKDGAIFDELYSTGLGIKNERYLDRKIDPRFKKLH